MSTPAEARHLAASTGIVNIRLSGQSQDTDALVAALEQLAAGQPAGRIEILTRSAPYANRRDPGQRLYLTVRVETATSGGTS
jgi:hypothetical protein